MPAKVGTPYKLPRLKTAMSLAFCDEAIFRRHNGRIGRIRTKRSVSRFRPPETQGRILGVQQCPASIGFHALATGLHVKIVAKSKPMFEQKTKTMPKYIQYLTEVCAQNMRW
jgi:hypothetical protein